MLNGVDGLRGVNGLHGAPTEAHRLSNVMEQPVLYWMMQFCLHLLLQYLQRSKVVDFVEVYSWLRWSSMDRLQELEEAMVSCNRNRTQTVSSQQQG